MKPKTTISRSQSREAANFKILGKKTTGNMKMQRSKTIYEQTAALKSPGWCRDPICLNL
jgi:hypothetical protein